ncbi:hypothetical protein [Robbsia andropogonis]|uniref:hypothetical protein n=1 Tax=Robbsia andropogonis TaxID=28092 RepID=UPI0020A14C84|nr:hypothetical protein [Robbsia andropogonis]MCP1118880.1 hypothetical protein [Robbsia andropogonis]MCP1128347.1 hypothetical protein [Robbsia andropogonis]
MRELPILFSGAMVRAILDGRKTQTRRVVKLNVTGRAQRGKRQWHIDDPDAVLACPYGQPGDRLWVRETWRGIVDINPPDEPLEFSVARYVPEQKYCRRVEYLATHERDGKPWRPSLHMPRWASRILLEITGVRVERMQQITDDDAIAEGAIRTDWGLPAGRSSETWHMGDATGPEACMMSPRLAFANLINKLHGGPRWNLKGPNWVDEPQGLWEQNPWVWVVSVKRVTA